MGLDDGDDGKLELALHPASDRFDEDDERWQEQVSLLFRELQRDVGGVCRRREVVEGTKGGVEAVILALGSAGAFTAGLEVFRAWLGRDRSRRLDISYTIDGRSEVIAITGDGIDKDAMAKLSEAVAGRLAGARWSGTAPS